MDTRTDNEKQAEKFVLCLVVLVTLCYGGALLKEGRLAKKKADMSIKTTIGGPPPTADCGTILGNDIDGELLVNNNATSCHVTFNTPWPAKPMCLAVPAPSDITSFTDAIITAETVTGFTIVPGFKLFTGYTFPLLNVPTLEQTLIGTPGNPVISGAYNPLMPGITGVPYVVVNHVITPVPNSAIATVQTPLVLGDLIKYFCFGR
jgi:hypothetical protein